MKNNIKRILENKFYILYKRVFDKDEIGYSYVIYSTDEYNSQHIKDFRYLQDAKRFFNKASKEAKQYQKELTI